MNDTTRQPAAPPPNGDVFTEVYSNIGDHNGLYIGPYKITELPYIFYNGNGLDFYPNAASMAQSGKYTIEHHTVVDSRTGQPPLLDLSITNLVAYQWIAMAIIFLVVAIFSRRSRPGAAPVGFWANALEAAVCYIKDEVVTPNFSNPAAANGLTFYFVATFLFILIINLVGLLPGGHAATGALPVTVALAGIAFFVINGAAIRYGGLKHWLHHLLGGAPLGLAPIMVPLELFGLLIKPFSLAIRLFANMTAGHIVLFSLLGLLFYLNTLFAAAAVVPFSVFIYLLELLVAFIQAFVFTMLVAIYTATALAHE